MDGSMVDRWVLENTCATPDRAAWEEQENWHEITLVENFDQSSGQYRAATRDEFVDAIEEMNDSGFVPFPLTEGEVYSLDRLAYWANSIGGQSEQILSGQGFVRYSISLAGLGVLVGAFEDVSESSPGDNDLPVKSVAGEIRLRYKGR